MKRHIYTLSGEPSEEIELPSIFNTPVRPDLILRAYLATRTKLYQPKGKSPSGDKKHVVKSPGVGYDISRVSRTNGGFGTARFIASAVGGIKVRAPKAEKVIIEGVNKKEKLLAIKSAIAATIDPKIIQMRGHKIEQISELPIVLTDEFENISKTAKIRELFELLGLSEEMERVRKGRRVRAGRGKLRGRKYKRRKGPLIIVSSKDAKVITACRNMEGIDVVPVEQLSILHLAPGGHPGRLTIWTVKALEKLTEKLNEIETNLKKRSKTPIINAK
ncbi:MAG: 50S ribosomal protein L4 [Candidatus Njordarchaeales archaeon]